MGMKDMPLWKRCRILANPVRLNMLILLSQQPEQYVKSIADKLGLTEDVASKNLQMLASGGFLDSEAVSKYLFYNLSGSSDLLQWVLRELKTRKSDAREMVFRTVTALTHERRVAIVEILKSEGPVDMQTLCVRAGMSELACRRHVNKLISRGWIRIKQKKYALVRPKNRLATELMNAVKLSHLRKCDSLGDEAL